MERVGSYLQSRKIMIQESTRVISRDPEKYSKMILGVLAMPLVVRGAGPVREAYFFMRHIDDVLDGDFSNLNQNSLEYVENIRRGIAERNLKANPICLLAERPLQVLEKRKKEGDTPRQDFLDGIDGMIRDYIRMQTREPLSDEDYRQNYIDSFSPHHNIALIGVRSNLRSKDMKIFSYCQGLAYGIQDFDTDWQRGLINIPAEVLSVSGITVSDSCSEVRSNSIVRDWVESETGRSRVDLNSFLDNLNSLPGEKQAKTFFNSLSRKVTRILEEPSF
jgi:phytoene/squalene synthetase